MPKLEEWKKKLLSKPWQWLSGLEGYIISSVFLVHIWGRGFESGSSHFLHYKNSQILSRTTLLSRNSDCVELQTSIFGINKVVYVPCSWRVLAYRWKCKYFVCMRCWHHCVPMSRTRKRGFSEDPHEWTWCMAVEIDLKWNHKQWDEVGSCPKP